LGGNLMDFIDHYAYKIAMINEQKGRLRFVTIDQLHAINERVNLVWWS